MEIVILLKEQIVAVDAQILRLEAELKEAKALKKKLDKAVKDFAPTLEPVPAEETEASPLEETEASPVNESPEPVVKKPVTK